MTLPNPTPDARAVVTGASSGIGEALATELAARGHSLILVARRGEVMGELATTLRQKHGVTVEVRACDLSDRDARAELVEELADRHVSILCNNAGIATFGPVSGLDPAYERAQVELNAVAVHDLTLAVLPQMVERRAGAILNVGSAAGNMPIPNNATYAATKAFVNTFSESLRGELKGTGVTVTAVCPGPVRTEFVEVAGVGEMADNAPEFVWTTAEEVAKAAIDGAASGKRTVVPGRINSVGSVFGRVAPRALTLPLIDRAWNR